MDKKKLIETAKKVFVDGVLNFLKDVVKNKVRMAVTIILGIAGTVTVTNPEFVGKTFRSIITDEDSKREILVLQESMKQLRDDWKASEQTNYYERRQFALAFKSFIEQTDKNFRILHDSLMKQNKRLQQFSRGEGTATISGSGEVKSGTFQDDWIDADVVPTSEGYNLNYDFTFKVKDVGLQYYDEGNGSIREVYRVQVQSLKNPESVFDLKDYERWTTTLTEEPQGKVTVAQPDALNLNVAYSGYGAEIGLSYSLWTFGGFRFIDLGIVSNID